MSTEVSNQLDRIEGAVGDIKTAITNKGTTVPSGAKIGDLAPLISSIRPQVNLQSKYVLPQDESRTVTADADYDGLSFVIVAAIPSEYKDTSSGDAVAGEILKGKKAWVDGSEVTGIMENRGAVSEILGVNAMGVLKTSAKIAAGYHNGDGQIVIIGETKTVTPDESTQNIGPTGGLNGSVLTKVTVNPIPSKYKDVTGADAEASQVVEGVAFLGKSGVVENGALLKYKNTTMAANAVNKTSNAVTIRTPFENPMYVENALYCDVPFEQFGDAEAAHVLKDKTFTSVDGFNATGTMTDRGAIDVKINPAMMPSQSYTIPKGYHDGNGKVSWEFTSSPTVYPTKEEQVVHSELGTVGMLSVTVKPIPSTYITTSDATASAGHIVDGETAYVDGEKVTGTLEKYDGSQLEGLAAGADENNVIVVTHFEDPNYVEGDSYVYSNVPLEGFGNATASDVRVGKTFTSSAGLKEDGTMPNVGVPAPTFTAQLDDDDDSGNTVWLRASVSQSAGYTAGGNNSTDIFPKLTVSGDTATMECGEVSISRKVTDPNLKAENIKKGVTIFGIVGTYEGEGNLATVNVNIADGDWCGPYDITYTNASGAQVTETVYCNDITIAILAGTPLYISIDNSASYSGAMAYDENNTLVGRYGWDENEIQLPTDGTYYSLYLCG